MRSGIFYFGSFFLSFILSAILFTYWIKKIPQLTRQKRIFFIGGLSLGGVVVGLSWRAGIWLPSEYPFFLILLFSSVMLLVGVLDDLREFSPSLKFALHTALVVAYCLLGGKRILFHAFPEFINYVLSFLWIVGITNAFNHLDIRDGLVSGIAFIIGVVLFFIALYTGTQSIIFLLLFLLGALCVFMIFNLHPAKIYMGNAGSHFIGFLLSTSAIYLDYSRDNLWVSSSIPLLIFAVPVLDTCMLMVLRLRKGVSVAAKTDDHFFFYCERKLGQSRSLYVFWLATLISSITAFIIFLSSHSRL